MDERDNDRCIVFVPVVLDLCIVSVCEHVKWTRWALHVKYYGAEILIYLTISFLRRQTAYVGNCLRADDVLTIWQKFNKRPLSLD